MAIVIVGHVILSLCKCGPGLCECGLHPIRELIHSFQSGWWRGFGAPSQTNGQILLQNKIQNNPPYSKELFSDNLEPQIMEINGQVRYI